MHKVFIDGQAGTTGLLIRARLDQREDIDLVDINDSERKDESIKQEIIKSSDVVILCLPDDAAKRSVELAEDAPVKFIDASTAHRVDPSWNFGLPELAKEQRHQNSKQQASIEPWLLVDCFFACDASSDRCAIAVPKIGFHRARGFRVLGWRPNND